MKLNVKGKEEQYEYRMYKYSPPSLSKINKYFTKKPSPPHPKSMQHLENCVK
jgi:hypothetical protein